MVCKRFETEEIAERIGDGNMKLILHDLEEDYDPCYLRCGVPGSDMDMGHYDQEEMEEYAERMGVTPRPIIRTKLQIARGIEEVVSRYGNVDPNVIRIAHTSKIWSGELSSEMVLDDFRKKHEVR